MGERKQDRLLGIRTVGLREWKDHRVHYNRYEATPYKALNKLAKYYKLDKTDKVVDFGCGRGRVVFYLHNRFQVPITGIEVNDETFEEAIENKESYIFKTKRIAAPINFHYGLAEHYKIDKDENCFYFFNPFSVHIFRKVINNILRSVDKHKRIVDLVLYYPVREYREFLEKCTPFTVINKIRIPGANDVKEKFLIYRLREELLKEEPLYEAYF